ncbi:hypothetical protein ONZ45_g8698 [Pleurotus djamor]|nr:hypothetical protein ONZ45_g8698 [Pleurotus djamor]
MTSITRNLPWFVRDLGVAIVGEKCYVSLVENLNLGDVPCLKYSLSKGLGIGIVVGGSIMKVPQLLLIVNAQSARGLSLEAYILETLSYAITLAYSFRNDFPFSTYGENFFLALQNTIITLLIIVYAPRRPLSSNPSSKLFTAATGMVVAAATLFLVPMTALSYLQFSTLPLSVFSKLPQIRQNARSQSTGQLSAFAVISQIAGCLARLFTTATEVGDSLLATGFALALALNCVLGAQMWMYWGKDEVSVGGMGNGKEKYDQGIAMDDFQKKEPPHTAQLMQEEEAAYTAAWTPPTPVNVQRMSTPPPSAGRKWARKVD